jgi:hypothetical protein
MTRIGSQRHRKKRSGASRSGVYMHSTVCVYIYSTRDSSRNAKCNTQEFGTAPTPLSSPSSILPPSSCQCASISARKNSSRVSEVLVINFKNFVSIKSHNLELLLSWKVSCLEERGCDRTKCRRC